ncbi:MAG: S41 family peptidase [Planctomycetota bacterium]
MQLPTASGLESFDAAGGRTRRPGTFVPFAAGCVLAVLGNWPFVAPRESPAGLILQRVADQVEQRFVSEVDFDPLLAVGINEILAQLDRHTQYIPPNKREDFEGEMDGYFVGIGVVIRPLENSKPPIIQLVAKQGPAARAGLRAGDEILRVDDFETAGADFRKVSAKIQGPPNSQVSLVIRRDEKDLLRLRVNRERVHLSSIGEVVFYDPAATDGIGYVRLIQFQPETAKDLETALSQLRTAGARRFVLDLRENSGGLLDEAVAVCELFLSHETIVSTRGRAHVDRPTIYRARAPAPFAHETLVVLIDKNTASASEIVTAALQDHRRAVVVGEESFGKWSVQEIIPLENGNDGLLKLTTRSFHAPIGRWIRLDENGQRHGIIPQLRVECDAESARERSGAWNAKTAERINDPLAFERLPIPSYDSSKPSEPAPGTERPRTTNDDTRSEETVVVETVDRQLVRALALLADLADYQRLLALEPPTPAHSAPPAPTVTGSTAVEPPPGGAAYPPVTGDRSQQ